ncbi:uncharacterized protein EI90DRAFT_3040188 [Cantharellus anzutake]|uniref:uncharacterized protein n=1 Tax=Cantharellus anzutake TaxID=1750568 RepID=UPI001908C333|nr:uncharacterized protein EI90DRAFT_3040188 [Cantharellus anzutake]KAF8339065.1 hypothetical protein EI90DRAFT_3040188 [Cantharellus anzutake]
MGHVTIVPDTNVMISCLALVDELVKFIYLNNDMFMSILLPGIVMAELDGLRKNASRSCQSEAQEANKWAVSELMKKGAVRGQRDSATLVDSGSWRNYYYQSGKENPDGFIIDCVLFEWMQAPSGRWTVLTMDQNCAAQCLSNGVPIASRTLIGHFVTCSGKPPYAMGQNYTRSAGNRRKSGQRRRDRSPDWARAASQTQAPRKIPEMPSNNDIAAGMDLDEEMRPSSVSEYAIDPRDELRDQLIAYLQSALYPIVETTIECYHKLQDQFSQKTEGSSDSIHARPPLADRKSSSSRTSPKPSLPLPPISSVEHERWSLSQCVDFLSEWRPISERDRPTKPIPFTAQEKSSLSSLAHFVQCGNRRGREFARGDWDKVCDGLKILCPGVQDVFEKAVKEAFDALLAR